VSIIFSTVGFFPGFLSPLSSFVESHEQPLRSCMARHGIPLVYKLFAGYNGKAAGA
jgi:hypothetical protein